eukprot:TRINITY_DN21718_c0_g1_i1.p1 TRINITY_DN21718_c0_g1~~TRINITY_DN21718_c0_g1_i1.p1  ORF type:complete len:275 (-),score=61.96 TRINITY_DN21718_c0_g1_i1:31-762(-)
MEEAQKLMQMYINQMGDPSMMMMPPQGEVPPMMFPPGMFLPFGNGVVPPNTFLPTMPPKPLSTIPHATPVHHTSVPVNPPLKTRGRKRNGAKKEEDSEDSDSDAEEELPINDGNKSKKEKSRLIKNREAAQLFRQRQKAYIQDLETKVNTVTTENADNKAKLELLRSENKLIKEQLAYLRNFISQAIAFSYPLQNQTQAMHVQQMVQSMQNLQNMQQMMQNLPQSGTSEVTASVAQVENSENL